MNNFLITVAVKLLMVTGGEPSSDTEKQEISIQEMSIEERTLPDTIIDLKDTLHLPVIEIE